MTAGHELILGGQRSGKSRRAEGLAQAWLQGGAGRAAVLLATALAGDAEMAQRIARHRQDRAARVPGMQTAEEPRDLPGALQRLSRPGTLVVVDCLTVWLGNWLMPLQATGNDAPQPAPVQALLEALVRAEGPVVLVSNEIGLGVIPLGYEVRSFVDALGHLNQAVAGICDRVTFMAAGLPLPLKGTLQPAARYPGDAL
jgi:adenosylcobinamide kinase / adenosylcobinamide-phosphate guanylyltransferase